MNSQNTNKSHENALTSENTLRLDISLIGKIGEPYEDVDYGYPAIGKAIMYDVYMLFSGEKKGIELVNTFISIAERKTRHINTVLRYLKEKLNNQMIKPGMENQRIKDRKIIDMSLEELFIECADIKDEVFASMIQEQSDRAAGLVAWSESEEMPDIKSAPYLASQNIKELAQILNWIDGFLTFVQSSLLSLKRGMDVNRRLPQ